MGRRDCSTIKVVISHSYGDITTLLKDWTRRGPGERKFTHPIKAICADDDRQLPLSVIPLRYRNNTLSRFLIRIGFFDDPWEDIEG